MSYKSAVVCCFVLLFMGSSSAELLIKIGSGGVVRELVLDQDKAHTARIENAVSGHTLRTVGPEFAITWGNDGARTSSDEFTVRTSKTGGAGAVVILENKPLGLAAEITYAAAPDRPWVYKTIRFINEGQKPFLLRTVEVERLTVVDETVTYAVDPKFPSLGDWGQPVYTESLWFGLEFPASRSSATPDGAIFLRHHPGIEIAPGASYTTKRSVIGAAARGAVEPAFMEYVRALAPRKNAPEAHNYWNGFRVIKPPNRTEQGVKMVEYAKKLKELTGFTFDAWSYDAGFDMYRPDGLFVPMEPEIWKTTQTALQPTGIPLGMWTSFSCIFDTPTHAWGKTQGYELQHPASYCLAGPTYFAAIKARLEELVSTYHMNSINFDGMYGGQGFLCNEAGHGHLVGEGAEKGVYATERVVENKMAIFAALRAINPGIILDLFVCNEWASPWWLSQLDGVHTVAGDTLGCDIPSPWLRDELISVRDIQVFDEHRRLKRQFPLWAEDLYGTQVRADHLIDGFTVTGESMAARWEDEYVMAYPGRGPISNHILCSDLKVLDESKPGLRFLGEVGNWVKANAALYRNATLLGGDPARWQPYGYAHYDGAGRCFIALRNPWIEPRQFALTLNSDLGLSASDAPVYVNIVYPYRRTFAAARFGATVEIPLQDYQAVLLEVRTESRQLKNAPSNARWSVDDKGVRTEFDTSAVVQPGGALSAAVEPGALHITGTVTAPANSTGQVQILLAPAAGTPGAPTVRVDNRAAEFAFHKRVRDNATGAAWVLLDLAPGVHSIDVTLPGRGAVGAGAWIVANYVLPVRSTVQLTEPVEALFPVVSPNEDRRIAALMPLSEFTLPMGALPDAATVNLSDLSNRVTECVNGFGRVGWNESGWAHEAALKIGAQSYTKGVGVHAAGKITFDIAGQFRRFTAAVGLHGIPADVKADKNKMGSCEFIVEGDGKELFKSPVLREGAAPLAIDVPIEGVKLLSIRTTDAGDSNWDDLATWADAQIMR